MKREDDFQEKVRRIDRAAIGILVNIVVSILTTAVILIKAGVL